MRLQLYRAWPCLALLALAACGAPPPAAAPTAAPAPTTAPTVAPTPMPTAAPAATAAPTATAAPAPGGPDLTPKVRTVWNTAIGANTMAGSCSGNPLLPAYGQVQLTPSGDTLEYKNQQTTYLFKRKQPSVWTFVGPSPLGDGNVDMTLTFKDDKNLSVVHKLVPGKDPNCTHTFNYSGTFMWERP